jgi:hypothetical protein
MPYTKSQFIDEYGEDLGGIYWRNGQTYSLDGIMMGPIREGNGVASVKTEKIMKIVINRAENLQKTDNFGSSDPYVKLLLNGRPIEGGKSKVIKNTQSPCWDFAFNVHYIEETFENLTFQVYDSDFGMSDDFHGQVLLLKKDLIRYAGRTLKKLPLDADQSKSSKENRHVGGELYVTFGQCLGKEIFAMYQAVVSIQRWFRLHIALKQLVRDGMNYYQALTLANTISWGKSRKARLMHEAKLRLKEKREIARRGKPSYMKKTKSISQTKEFVSQASAVSGMRHAFRQDDPGAESARAKRPFLRRKFHGTKWRTKSMTSFSSAKEGGYGAVVKGEVVRALRKQTNLDDTAAELEAEKSMRRNLEIKVDLLKKEVKRIERREEVRFAQYDLQMEGMLETLKEKDEEIMRLRALCKNGTVGGPDRRKLPDDSHTGGFSSARSAFGKPDKPAKVISPVIANRKKGGGPIRLKQSNTVGSSYRYEDTTTKWYHPDDAPERKTSSPTEISESKQRETAEKLSKPLARHALPPKRNDDAAKRPSWRGGGGNNTLKSAIKALNNIKEHQRKVDGDDMTRLVGGAEEGKHRGKPQASKSKRSPMHMTKSLPSSPVKLDSMDKDGKEDVLQTLLAEMRAMKKSIANLKEDKPPKFSPVKGILKKRLKVIKAPARDLRQKQKQSVERKRPKNRNNRRKRRSVTFEKGTRGNLSDEEEMFHFDDEQKEGSNGAREYRSDDFMSIKIFPDQEHEDFDSYRRERDKVSSPIVEVGVDEPSIILGPEMGQKRYGNYDPFQGNGGGVLVGNGPQGGTRAPTTSTYDPFQGIREEPFMGHGPRGWARAPPTTVNYDPFQGNGGVPFMGSGPVGDARAPTTGNYDNAQGNGGGAFLGNRHQGGAHYPAPTTSTAIPLPVDGRIGRSKREEDNSIDQYRFLYEKEDQRRGEGGAQQSQQITSKERGKREKHQRRKRGERLTFKKQTSTQKDN